MITLLKQFSRSDALMHIRKNFPDYELIRIEDTITDSTKISQEIESSDLFGKSRAVFLSDIPRDFWDILIESLDYIPPDTVVFWREDSFPVAYIKQLPKHTILEGKKTTTSSTKSNPFVIANQLSVSNPTQLWATYQSLLDEGNEPEAVFGILWWKLKDIAKKKKNLSSEFKKTLRNFLLTYSTARETGGDLETGLEKILLSLTKKDLA